MEKIFFDLENESFVVHLVKDDHWKEGYVYPIIRYLGTNDWSYESHHDGGGIETEDGATCLFSFLFCWRGVWEGRIFFQDDEYWSEQLPVISDLWAEIEKNLKARIKKQYPDNMYDP